MISYNWFRVFHGVTTDLKWRLIARNTGLPEGLIVSVWIAVLEYASQQEERGSVLNFPCEDYDCCLGYEDGTCKKVFSAFVQRGLITGDFVTSWDKRQSLQDGMSTPKTNAQRQADYRERQRQAAQAQAEEVTKSNEGVTENNGGVTDVTKSNEVTLYKRREEEIREDKIREEEIRKEEKENTPPIPPNGGKVDKPKKTRSSGNHPVNDKGYAIPEKDFRPDDFEQWWAIYPGTEKRDDAVSAWEKAVRDRYLPELPVLLKALEWQIPLHNWRPRRKGDPQNNSTPYPASYLNGKRWRDEEPAPYQAQQARPAFQSGGYVPFTNKAMELIDVHNANQQVIQEVLAEMRAEEEQKKQKALGGQ